MRTALIAILIAMPTALVTWVVSRGVYYRETEACVCEPGAAGSQKAPDPNQALRTLLHSPLGTAQASGEVSLYDAEGLFDYINGAAPIFIERAFRQLVAADLVTAEGGELTCDIYDMTDAKNAASIYEKEAGSSTKALNIGDAGRLGRMALVFRRDRFYVKMTAYDGKGEEALPGLAKALDARMQ